MFTLKFIKNYDSGQTRTAAVACPAYEFVTFGEGITVLVFKDFVQENGVSYFVGGREDSFDVCYVENQAGKTIDRIQASSDIKKDYLPFAGAIQLAN